MFCGNDNIMWNITHIQYECEEYYVQLMTLYGIFLTFSLNVKIFYKILYVPQNTAMAMNSAMVIILFYTIFCP